MTDTNTTTTTIVENIKFVTMWMLIGVFAGAVAALLLLGVIAGITILIGI